MKLSFLNRMDWVNDMNNIIGYSFFIIAVLGGLFIALWLMLGLGIVNIIEEVQSENWSGFIVFMNVIRILLSVVAGWIVATPFAMIGTYFLVKK